MANTINTLGSKFSRDVLYPVHGVVFAKTILFLWAGLANFLSLDDRFIFAAQPRHGGLRLGRLLLGIESLGSPSGVR
jgi:hypothetical protein